MKGNPRLQAAIILSEVISGRSLSASLAANLSNVRERDRALVQAMTYGVCRFYTQLTAILKLLLKKPLPQKDQNVYALLLVGLYQLIHMRVPPHAAVAETVNAAKAIKKSWASLVNAILREFERKRAQLEMKIQADPTATYAHPLWWIEQIKKDWPEDWQVILKANNAHPPFTLRVNQARLTREEYGAKLQANDIPFAIVPETRNGILLSEARAVNQLPGFTEGEVSVQDGATQLAAELLDLSAGQRILDACAAPGGKLTHILELEPQLAACIAIDNDAERLQSIQESLTRLHLNATCICADANDTKTWWDGELFDRILLDAPCSASGVIRRHPDIKLLRKPTDIPALAKQQLQLLHSLWPFLNTGGILLYATCSIFPTENEKLVQKFLAECKNAKELPIEASWGKPRSIGRQILPSMHNMDGFYYAKLQKF